MIILAAGVLLFVLLHGVAAVPRYKSYVKSRTGERWYGPVFGLASLFAIAVIVLGWRSSDFVAVYEPRLLGLVCELRAHLHWLPLPGNFPVSRKLPPAPAVSHGDCNGVLGRRAIFSPMAIWRA